jgi:hypothetical protein
MLVVVLVAGLVVSTMALPDRQAALPISLALFKINYIFKI